MNAYFTDLDGAGEPTIFEATDSDPAVVVRRAELPGPRTDLLWRVLTGVLCEDDEIVERVAEIACPYWAPDGLGCDLCRDKTRAVLAALRDAD